MPKTFHHLTLSDRITIESMLSICKKPYTIASELGFSRQAITSEIIRSRIQVGSASGYGRYYNGCVYQPTCNIRHICGNASCNKKCVSCRSCNCVGCCDEFAPVGECPYLQKSPHVCNGCPMYRKCPLQRYTYSASSADARAQGLLISSREGIDLNDDELDYISHIVSPLLTQGQSPSQIWNEHSGQLPISERSFYRYVQNGVLAHISVMDLPKAVRYRSRTHKKDPRKANLSIEALSDRTFADFLELDDTQRANCVEMDCVCGKRGDKKAILTLLWRQWMFQMMILLDCHDSKSVVAALDELEKNIGYDGFPDIILADRGSEFADASGIEESWTFMEDSYRCGLYYCDPMRSDQKAKCENNHRFIRRIIPKGTSLDGLAAKDMAEAMSHINSVPRASLGGKPPMVLAIEHLPSSFFSVYGIYLVPSDMVVLRPYLIG